MREVRFDRRLLRREVRLDRCRGCCRDRRGCEIIHGGADPRVIPHRNPLCKKDRPIFRPVFFCVVCSSGTISWFAVPGFDVVQSRCGPGTANSRPACSGAGAGRIRPIHSPVQPDTLLFSLDAPPPYSASACSGAGRIRIGRAFFPGPFSRERGLSVALRLRMLEEMARITVSEGVIAAGQTLHPLPVIGKILPVEAPAHFGQGAQPRQQHVLRL